MPFVCPRPLPRPGLPCPRCAVWWCVSVGGVLVSRRPALGSAAPQVGPFLLGAWPSAWLAGTLPHTDPATPTLSYLPLPANLPPHGVACDSPRLVRKCGSMGHSHSPDVTQLVCDAVIGSVCLTNSRIRCGLELYNGRRRSSALRATAMSNTCVHT